MSPIELHQSAARTANGNAISGKGANTRTRKIIAAVLLSGPVILNIVRSVLLILLRVRLGASALIKLEG
jgi:hypothetical protein